MDLKKLIEISQNYNENLPVVFNEIDPCFVDEVSLVLRHPKLGDEFYTEKLFDELVRDAASMDVEDLGWTTMTEEESAWINEEFDKQVKEYYDEAERFIMLDGKPVWGK